MQRELKQIRLKINTKFHFIETVYLHSVKKKFIDPRLSEQ